MNGDRNLSWADQCGANQDLKGILIAVSQMFHLFDFFYSGHMCDQVIGISPLIVIPGNQFYKFIIKGDPCFCIEYTGSGISYEIGRNDFFFCIT